MTTATDKRVFHKAFLLKDITFDPTDNYRWGSAESMERDLRAKTQAEAGDDASVGFETMKTSIATGGVEEPIGLRVVGTEVRIIYGFTRYVACKELGLEAIPAFLYEGISDTEAASLQLRENSTNLKRGVGWVATTRMFNRLVDSLVEECIAIPAAERPTDSRGFAKSARRTAIVKVCERMGMSERVLTEQARVIKNAQPEALEMAEEGRLNVWAMKELESGDKDNPYSREFVKEVLAESVRTSKGRAITTQEVRNALKRVKDKNRHVTVKKAGAKAEAYTPAASEMVDTRRVSGGCLRDIATNVAATYVAKHKLGSAEATDDAWAKLTLSSAWCIVQGVALSSGESPLPEGAESENGCDISQALRLTRDYTKSVFLRAIVRQEVTRRFTIHNYGAWLASTTDKNRTRRHEVAKAIGTVLAEAKDTDTMKALFMRVFDELRDSNTIPAIR
jgi:ParB-like chromosome segregation protein Spo0J